jgi:hypothetical protein
MEFPSRPKNDHRTQGLSTTRAGAANRPKPRALPFRSLRRALHLKGKERPCQPRSWEGAAQRFAPEIRLEFVDPGGRLFVRELAHGGARAATRAGPAQREIPTIRRQ